MTIYDIQILSERTILNFKPTRLYIKELFGIKYFGKTIVDNVESYSGSGNIWSKRIKKYGRKNIKTLWISDWYYDPFKIQKDALDFSRKNNIVESEEWANLWPENGINGGRTRKESPNKGKVTVIDKNGNKFLVEKNSTLITNGEVRTINKGTVGVIDLLTGKSKRVPIEEFNSNRSNFKTFTEESITKADELSNRWIGKMTVKDFSGKTTKVDVNDPRVLNGDLKPLLTGMVNVIDSMGNSFSVSINDPKYISGEYKFSGGPKKGYKQPIITCPHCGLSGVKIIY